MTYSPSTRTVQDVKKMVTRQFGDESGVQIEDPDIINWTNDALEEINRRNKVLTAYNSANSVIGQQAYTFPSQNILEVSSIHFDGSLLPNVSFAQAEENVINGQGDAANTGTPALWYEWAGSFSFWPIPNAVKKIELYYVKRPDRVTTLTDLLTLPDTYFQDVVRYVLQQAYEMDEDWQAAQAKGAQLDASLQDIGEAQRTAQNMVYGTMTLID